MQYFLILAFGLMTACSVTPPAPPPVPATETEQESLEENWLIERREQTQSLEDPDLVRVVNPHGEIRVRAHHKPEIFVLYNAQRHRDDAIGPEVEINHKPDSVEVTTHFEPHKGEVPESFKKRRIDLTVFVPATTPLHLESDSGLLETRGMKGELNMTSTWGDMRTRHAGPLNMKSQYGSLQAMLQDTRWSKDSRIETLTGDILVFVAKNGSLEVEMESHDSFATDFSLTVEKNPETGLKSAKATLGENGKMLFLKTARGQISLLESNVKQPE